MEISNEKNEKITLAEHSASGLVHVSFLLRDSENGVRSSIVFLSLLMHIG